MGCGPYADLKFLMSTGGRVGCGKQSPWSGGSELLQWNASCRPQFGKWTPPPTPRPPTFLFWGMRPCVLRACCAPVLVCARGFRLVRSVLCCACAGRIVRVRSVRLLFACCYGQRPRSSCYARVSGFRVAFLIIALFSKCCLCVVAVVRSIVP